MSKTPMKASDPNDLERHILDPNIAKSEAEWWAKSRIEELERENTELKLKVTKFGCVAASYKNERDAMQAALILPQERDQLRERVRVLETQLLSNNPLLDEAADKIDQLSMDVERLNKLVVEAKQAFDGINVDSRGFDRGMAILDEALAATGPK